MLYIQPKTQFKVQIISILEEVDSLIDQNCTSCAKKIGQGPSPPRPHLDKLQKKAFFLRKTSCSFPTRLSSIFQHPETREMKHSDVLATKSDNAKLD